MRRARRLLLLVAALALLPIVSPASAGGRARVTTPNVIVILMDDQRVGTDEAMQYSTADISDLGVRFTNAFVPLPMCCPSRTSLLTGNYSHTTGVWTNGLPFGGFAAFDDRSTIATWLHGAGYRTGLFGKYLNGYGNEGPDPYVPPGWDTWAAYHADESYSDFSWIDETGAVTTDTTDYATYFFANRAAAFVRSTPPGTPLFLYFAPFAPHTPAVPAPEDALTFADLPDWRPPSFNERDLTGKPSYVQAQPRFTRAERRAIDALRIDQYRSMYSTDRAISWIIGALADTGRLGDTIVVFTSDNGFLWGEHRLTGKSVPYDMATRVPLSIRYDAAGWRGTRNALVANVDIAPTIAELAGLTPPRTDGRSLVGVLDGSAASVRSTLVMEHSGTPQAPPYCGVRTAKYLFVHYADGFEELYRYAEDPYELVNRAGARAAADIVSTLRNRAIRLCSPTPPRFSWG